ncbi:hypothetical protein GCK72_004088 [Caenorhabditis remanei]|uniref:RING-type domain-containing protein n=1 Tax=Caenorhabditis remanei TaxID=31234 RepID=A0A6A5HB92_CAERE|nr:hypothetical protein GCK72_004088 [Caenorhabditis remanei]KAF1764141.1 hypothetical protein GCK72_004088 [Caenorhabditis remanei]
MSTSSFPDQHHVVISIDALRCKVCSRMFPGTPQKMNCGHSLCLRCYDRFAIEHESFHCPICGKPVWNTCTAPNFELKGILDSMDKIAGDQRGLLENNLDVATERMIEDNKLMAKQVEKLERENGQFRRDNEQLRRKYSILKEYSSFLGLLFGYAAIAAVWLAVDRFIL